MHIHNLKRHEPDTVRLTAQRRVTYDIEGKPLIRLAGDKNDRAETSVGDYLDTKRSNDEFFKKLNKTVSLNDKLALSSSHYNKKCDIKRVNGRIFRVDSLDLTIVN